MKRGQKELTDDCDRTKDHPCNQTPKTKFQNQKHTRGYHLQSLKTFLVFQTTVSKRQIKKAYPTVPTSAASTVKSTHRGASISSCINQPLAIRWETKNLDAGLVLQPVAIRQCAIRDSASNPDRTKNEAKTRKNQKQTRNQKKRGTRSLESVPEKPSACCVSQRQHWQGTRRATLASLACAL